METQTLLRLLLSFSILMQLTLYLFIIYLDNKFKTPIELMQENGFTFKNIRMYTEETIKDANYADDIAFLANTPTQCWIGT